MAGLRLGEWRRTGLLFTRTAPSKRSSATWAKIGNIKCTDLEARHPILRIFFKNLSSLLLSACFAKPHQAGEAHKHWLTLRGDYPPKPMMHIAYSPISQKITNFPLFPKNVYISSYFRSIYVFCLIKFFGFPYFLP